MIIFNTRVYDSFDIWLDMERFNKTQQRCLLFEHFAVQTCFPDCGILPSLTNGTVNQSGGTIYLDTTHFTCDLGFNLQGTSVRTCGPDGTWDNAQPTCEIAGTHDAFAVHCTITWSLLLSKCLVF